MSLAHTSTWILLVGSLGAASTRAFAQPANPPTVTAPPTPSETTPAESTPVQPEPKPDDVVAQPPMVSQPEPTPAAAADDETTNTSEPSLRLSSLQLHGFVSQGGFYSTDNDYIGHSSRGSIELFEAGLNVSAEVADRLRVGLQFFARDVGAYRDLPPRLDWAFIDYRWKSWLGVRAGVIKLPFGLYNEFADIDAARLPILMPQSVYQLRNRSALLAHTGFAIYGRKKLGEAGLLEYQALLGTLDIPDNALVLDGARLDGVDTKYMTGGQIFYRPPIEGLRIGATYLRTSIDFNLTLDEANTSALIMAGLVPPDYDGKLVISQRPSTFVVGSAEYTREDWLFAAEYARTFKHQRTTLPKVLPTFDDDSERFYVMVNRRFNEHVESGIYYSVLHADADDRRGRNEMKFPERFYAFQRDLATTLRYDVNEHWLWKLEAHFIDGVADLLGSTAKPERYWGLFLINTTVTF